MFVQMASKLKNPKETKKNNRTTQNKPEKQAEAAVAVPKSFSSPTEANRKDHGGGVIANRMKMQLARRKPTN